MEKSKLRRTLYIGLGGTGFKTLVHTKKAFIETYGEVPPMIKFLAFDSDVNQNRFSVPSTFGDITLDPSEKSSISVTDARARVARAKNQMTWFPDNNMQAVVDLVNGCGMIRTNGRIAFAFNYSKTRNAIQKAINEVKLLNHVLNDNYELLSYGLDVNIVFSIAGGTGSGTFLDMAYLVKDILLNLAIEESSKVIGYMVLPDVYDAQLTMGKDKLLPIGCAALIDLDYLSHLDFDSTINANYITDVRELTGSPFNSVFAIGNTNSNGDVVDHSDKLSQMMSLAMVVSAGQISGDMSSIANNTERDMNSGDFDIENKRAIMGTLGMSEITFRATDLKRLYTVKAAREIAAALLNPGKDSDTDANNWIDEMKIRENNGRDDVIDYLIDKKPGVIFSNVCDKANPKNDVNNYRIQGNVTVDNAVLTQKIDTLKTNVNKAFGEKIVSLVNNVGPAYAMDFIAQVRNQIEICIGEMRSELADFQNAVNAKESAIETAVEDYKAATKKIFGNANAIAEANESLSAAVMNAVINAREIQRRNGAITFYTWLINTLNAAETRLGNIADNIKSACTIISKVISGINSQINDTKGLFEIDLTKPYIEQVKVGNDDIVINQFVQSLGDGEKVNDFGELTPDAIAELMIKYAATIKTESDWEKLSVEDALKRLGEKGAKEIITKAIKLASPMCMLNFRGHINKDLLNYYFIGVKEQSTTSLNGGILDIKNCINSSEQFEVNFASIGSKDRIVIYHQYGVFPTFAIAGTAGYRHAYDRYMQKPKAYSFHFDEDLRLKMEREGFSVIPKERTDNSLELWVKGLIFGLITRDENGVFYYYDETNDDAALDNYKTSLNTSYRDEAFRTFQMYSERLMPQYENIMAKRAKQEGQNVIDTLLNDAKENYLEKYSLNEYSKADLDKSLYKVIKTQLIKEINFAKKNI